MTRNASSGKQSALVVGGGLGGLSAAIHLSLAGLDVTLCESNDRIGGRANLLERDGFRFDTGPSLLNYPWVFRDLFRAAGRDMDDYVTLRRVDPSIRFLWPDNASFTLTSDYERLREAVAAFQPDADAALASFFADAERKYNFSFTKLVTKNADHLLQWISGMTPRELASMSVWRNLDGELKRFFKSRRVREALGSYAMYLGGSPWQLPGLFSILPYGELAYGLWLPHGGIYGLIEAIGRLAEELGVVLRTGSPVERILVENTRVRGVQLASGEQIASPLVVSNVDVPTTRANLLPPEYATIDKGLKMTPGVVTYYWGFENKIESLPHHAIFLPDDCRGTFDQLLKSRRIPDQPAFYVSTPSATDPTLAPDGASLLFVLVPVPLMEPGGEVDWSATVRRIEETVLDRLEHHGIELPIDTRKVNVAWTPETWNQRFGLWKGSAFGASHILRQMGPLRSPNVDRKIQGLYYVGAGTTPGTGLPMVVLGGAMTAERVLADVR